MSVRRYAIVASFVAASLGAAALPASAAKFYRAEQYDTRVVVEPGGSILVTETVRFEFGPDAFTSGPPQALPALVCDSLWN